MPVYGTHKYKMKVLLSYHFTKTVVEDVKVWCVSWIRDFRQERCREFVQGTPVQSTEKLMIPKFTGAFPSKTDFPVTDQFIDEGTSLLWNLRARRRKLKILLRVIKKSNNWRKLLTLFFFLATNILSTLMLLKTMLLKIMILALFFWAFHKFLVCLCGRVWFVAQLHWVQGVVSGEPRQRILACPQQPGCPLGSSRPLGRHTRGLLLAFPRGDISSLGLFGFQQLFNKRLALS